jgi:AraC-like DNA-binding protein
MRRTGDTSNFSRASKRWFGVPPAVQRERQWAALGPTALRRPAKACFATEAKASAGVSAWLRSSLPPASVSTPMRGAGRYLHRRPSEMEVGRDS